MSALQKKTCDFNAKLRRFCLLIFLFYCVTVTACSSQEPEERSGDSNALKFVKADLNQHPEIILKHDFGIVSPDSELEHVFTVVNPSRSNWTIKEARTVCSCTTSQVSSNTLKPGKSISVPVKYKPGTVSVDDVKTVTLVFNEAGAPLVRLLVACQVRAPLTLSQTPVRLNLARHQPSVKASIVVGNFGTTKWSELAVECPDSWLQIVKKPLLSTLPQNQAVVNQENTKTGPIEQWVLEFTADPLKLDYGDYQANVTIRGAEYQEILPVFMSVAPRVSIIPKIALLAIGKDGKTSSRRITVVFADAKDNAREDQVALKMRDLPDLAVRWEPGPERVSYLHLEWRANFAHEASGQSRGIQGNTVGEIAVAIRSDLEFTIPVTITRLEL